MPAFVVVYFLDDSCVAGERWNLSVILICISFMAKDMEHRFMHVLAISASSFENYLHCNLHCKNCCSFNTILMQIMYCRDAI
jgi:hypothetical protein